VRRTFVSPGLDPAGRYDPKKASDFGVGAEEAVLLDIIILSQYSGVYTLGEVNKRSAIDLATKYDRD